MEDRPCLIVEILPHEDLSIQFKYPGYNLPGPIRVSRCDLLYAMLCDVGVSLTIPCRKIMLGGGHV